MKRISIIFSILVAAVTVTAQTSKEINFDQLKAKVEKGKVKTQHPKKGVKPKTWIKLGELYMDVYDAQILRAYVGMDPNTFMLVVGNPLKKEQIEEDGAVIDKYIFDRVTFYFNQGKLERWEVTKPVVEKPLDLAYESFIKAKELDAKNKSDKKIAEDLTKLKGLYVNEGSNAYTLKKYKEAFEYFKKVIEIGQNPLLNHKDTAIYYYAGLSAQLGNLLEECIPFYQKAIELEFTSEGSAYYNIYDAYKNLGKADEGLKYLEQGFLKFPKNTNILFALISHYIDKQEDPAKIITYIDKAIENEPNNTSLHFAKGTLYDRLEDFDNAVACYKKAIELDPNYFDAYYNIGALYFNRGVKYIEEANKVPAKELEKYDALMDKANAEFKKAIPYMEGAYKANPQSKEALEALKNIYFRFRNENPEMKTKYEECVNKLKELQ
ncbi:MAG: hypothetical protein PWR03_1445 [Tenuifilum sp.]|jgi:tetratricopeptide (TPR) repeat protein|uniref:tetratricopeptide repeat protein n=1 Tax=Tenuifilum sp. TaxID=2760880 RepID=UPI0024AB7841|nr:tetratricopeptide repeat protein [Tenuifilum sp.]MDI3527262.1 hypothetical protein [Tenuifilum sp.]